MPYKSDAQRRYFNANRERLESEGVDVDEWNKASKGRKLPKRASLGDLAPPGGFLDRAEDALSGEERLPPQAYLALAGLLGLGGAYGGAGPGAMLGLGAGAGRGNTAEGLGRGLLRGGATGAGVGVGAGLGAGLGSMLGHTGLGAGVGAGLGGLAGWLGSGAALGPPAGRAKEGSMRADVQAAAKQAMAEYVRTLADRIPASRSAVKMAATMRAADQLVKLAGLLEQGSDLFQAVDQIYRTKSAAYRHQVIAGLTRGLAAELQKQAERPLGRSAHPSASMATSSGTSNGVRTVKPASSTTRCS